MIFKKKLNNDPKILGSKTWGPSEEVKTILKNKQGLSKFLLNSFTGDSKKISALIEKLQAELHDDYLQAFEKEWTAILNEEEKIKSEKKEAEIKEIEIKNMEQEKELGLDKLGKQFEELEGLWFYEKGIVISTNSWFSGRTIQKVMTNIENIQYSLNGEHFEYDVLGGVLLGGNIGMGGKKNNGTLSISFYFDGNEHFDWMFTGSNAALQQVVNKLEHYKKIYTNKNDTETNNDDNDKLIKYAEMFQDGLLTKEEFDTLKTNIIKIKSE